MWEILNIRYTKNKTRKKKPYSNSLEQETHKPMLPVYESITSLAIQIACSTLSPIHSYCQQLESREVDCTSSTLPFLLEV